ncbi:MULTISPECIES: hypothetical protein [Streptomyces]|uniref:Uncharacterized protein n=2 Tax=Streptomyces TaxID=1883 RepID=A0ABV9J1X7_9ACTN
MIRLRLQVVGWRRRSLVLTDTPRPDCADCRGDGWIASYYGDADGEYADTEWDPCTCWNENRRAVLLPLPRRPRWLRRRTTDGRDSWAPAGYSNEPPF